MTQQHDNHEPASEGRTGRKSVTEELSALVEDDLGAILGWVCLIVASLVFFWTSEGTQYHQLAAGVLMTSSTLFILTALLECLWRLSVDRNS